MAEETPAIIDLTVIWRPACDDEFRVDHVTCEAGSRIAAVMAAADIYVNEIEYADDETPMTAHDVIFGDVGYETIAILEGHVTEHVPSY